MIEDRAFFWITSGGHFMDEASASAMSVANVMPDIPQFHFTTEIGFLEKRMATYSMAKQYDPWYLQSTWMMTEALNILEDKGYRKVIYMDADTHMIEPVYELFDLASHFDFSGTRAPGRKTTAHLQSLYPSSLFPEMNMGVNPMFVPRAIHLWDTALSAYKAFERDYGDNDQGPLRDALIHHVANDENFRMYTMPQEYNCRFIMPMFLNGRVKILHGRNNDLSKIANDINAQEGMRLWRPYQLL